MANLTAGMEPPHSEEHFPWFNVSVALLGTEEEDVVTHYVLDEPVAAAPAEGSSQNGAKMTARN